MAGIVKTGQSVTAVFTTASPATGAATNADSLPTGTLYVNGTANAATVTVTNITTGVYKAAVTLPTLSAGDVVDIRIAATVAAVAGNGVVWSAIGDTKRLSDTLAANPAAGGIVAGSFAAGAIDAGSIAADAIGASELAADAVAEIQSGLATSAAQTTAQTDLTTLTGRLTSARAGYLDNLSAGAVATASALASLVTTVAGIVTSIAAIPASVWAYATRTLTQAAASVVAAVTGSNVTVYRGTRWSIALTGLPTNTGYTAIIFSVKRFDSDTDADAIFQVRTTTGLTAFDGAPTVTAGQAAITVNSATAITITAEAATTVYATPGVYSYGVKYLDGSGFPSQASIGGTFRIVGDIPKAIT